MTNLERIAEWRKGCSIMSANDIKEAEKEPSGRWMLCTECTIGLIKAIEADLLAARVNPNS